MYAEVHNPKIYKKRRSVKQLMILWIVEDGYALYLYRNITFDI